MDNLREKYFRTVGLSDEPAAPSTGDDVHAEGFHQEVLPSVDRALSRAHELRKFEIEHYWKRGTYFWGFQVAIFAAFGLLWRDGTVGPWHPIAFALGAIGFLTAIANRLSACGSKFWQNNWERHIDMLEDKVEGRLHKTVWLQNGEISYSVSRINQHLSFCFIEFWLVVLVYTGLAYGKFGVREWLSVRSGIPNVPSWMPDGPQIYVLFIVAVTVLHVLILFRQTTNLEASLPQSSGQHGAKTRRSSEWHRRFKPTEDFVRRYAPGESE